MRAREVSVLFNEPKLLKCLRTCVGRMFRRGFSALQRAEIAEIFGDPPRLAQYPHVSVLFNEPKLLKYYEMLIATHLPERFSALQRAEIAEIVRIQCGAIRMSEFQCSSTSRNC